MSRDAAGERAVLDDRLCRALAFHHAHQTAEGGVGREGIVGIQLATHVAVHDGRRLAAVDYRGDTRGKLMAGVHITRHVQVTYGGAVQPYERSAVVADHHKIRCRGTAASEGQRVAVAVEGAAERLVLQTYRLRPDVYVVGQSEKLTAERVARHHLNIQISPRRSVANQVGVGTCSTATPVPCHEGLHRREHHQQDNPKVLCHILLSNSTDAIFKFLKV